MLLSVIIPCFNAAKTIGAQLNALADQSWDKRWEVVVADNRSTDDSLAMIERCRDRLPNIRVVDASARPGQPYALNVGAAAASGEAIAFCDADDEVAPGWVSAMGEALSRHDFVACRIDTEKLNPSWVYAGLGQHHPQRTGLHEIWYPPYLLHGGGGTLGVKRALHESVGGFDESLPYVHDTDYCFRLQLAGVKLHFVPEALTYIRYRHDLNGLFHQARHWAEYNVKVYKRYRLSVARRDPHPWRTYFCEWNRVIQQFSCIRRKQDLALALWEVGWQIGRLVGSVKHKVSPV